MNKIIINFILTVVLIYITAGVYAQSASYFYAGWSFEKLNNTDPLNIIVNDFNTFHESNGRTLSRKLEAPGMFDGLVLGLKADIEAVTLGIDYHAHTFKSISEYTDSLNNTFIKQMRVVHHGFTLAFGRYLVHAKSFRMGPVLCFNFEQFRVKLTNSKKMIDPAIDIATDIFYFSPSLKFPLSIGNKKFTFDIVPYYQMPLYKMNMTKLNNMLNEGFATEHSKDNMMLKPTSFGCFITLNFAISK